MLLHLPTALGNKTSFAISENVRENFYEKIAFNLKVNQW